MNGAPANPISGVRASSRTRVPIASVTKPTAAGSSSGSRSRSARVSIGSSTTGPTPGTMSTPNPIAFNGTTMSLK